jgi:cytochrome c556
MRMFVRVLASTGVVLALGVCLLTLTQSVSADGEKEAQDQILKLSDAIDKGDAKSIEKETQALQKMELLPIMSGFKKRDATPPGLGFGPKPGQYNPDGIEAQIMGLSKKELTADALKKQAADILKAAQVTEAIAKATAVKGPAKKMGDKDPKEWAKWTKDMEDASKALGDAAKKGDAKALKDAAGKLNASCNNCHGIFRDS